MSGFEPIAAQAVAAEVGTTALASEVVAANALAAANAAAYTPAIAGSLASIPAAAGLGALASAVPGMYGVGTATTGALSGGVPTLVEQIATTNPEILSQVQTALKPALLEQPLTSGLSNVPLETLRPEQIAELTKIPTSTPIAQVAGEFTPDMFPAEMIPQAPVAETTLETAGTKLSPMEEHLALKKAASQINPPNSPFAQLMDKSKYLTKAKEWFDKQDNEDLALYGAGAGLGLAALNKKKKGVAEAAPYSGPLSRFRFDPDRYTAQQFTPPTPYQARYAQGGLSDLGGYSDGGRMLKGPGDGMSDNIPASIAGKQPARLANEEFVVPADVVSHLGNGSSEAGAKQLYKMMDRVRQARTGKKAQGKQIKADKYMPA